MPSKYRIILEMASQTARDIASNADRYTDFLITAANNYKYSFKEQLLIHAQKPDATACAEIDTWNKLGRWVNKGTKGIALLIDRDVPYKLRHVFDISDTNSRAGRNITLWQMKPEYEYAVSESLQASFGDVEEPRDFPHLLIDRFVLIVIKSLSQQAIDRCSVQKSVAIKQGKTKRKPTEKQNGEITITDSVNVLCVEIPIGLHTANRNSAPKNVKG